MTHAQSAGGYPFPIEDFSFVQLTIQPVTIQNETLQQVDLNVAHETGFDLPRLDIPTEVQGGLFLLQLLEFGEHHPWVTAVGEADGVGKDGVQDGLSRIRFHSQSLPRIGGGESRDGHDISRRDGIDLLVFVTRIQAKLGNLFGDGTAVGCGVDQLVPYR